MSRQRAPKVVPRAETFWTKASYIAAQDNQAVAIYRIATGAMGVVLFAMLAYFGNRIISAEDELRADVGAIRVEIGSVRGEATGAVAAAAELKGVVNMDHARADRVIDRLNDIDNRVSRLEAVVGERRLR